MELQKALESDGWINPDRQPCQNGGLAGAGSVWVCWGGMGPDHGRHPEADTCCGVCPSVTSPTWVFPAAAFFLCKTASPCLIPRQLLSRYCVVLGIRKETAIFLEPREEEGCS